MFTRTLPLAVFLLGLLALTGCSSALQLEKVDVRIKDLSSTTSGTMMTLQFINSNNLALVVHGTEHTLYLNGTLVGLIKSHQAVGIPPLGTVSATISLLGTTAKAADRFIAEHPGSAAYRLESTLHLNWGEDTRNYKTTDVGHVNLNPASITPLTVGQ